MGNADHLLSTSSASGNNLVVQMVLAGYANAEHECWPGQDSIAERARCGLRTVRRAIDWLVEHEGLEVTVNGGPANPVGDPTNLYKLPEHWFAPSKLGTGQIDPCQGRGQNGRERNIDGVSIGREETKTTYTKHNTYSSEAKMAAGQNGPCPKEVNRCSNEHCGKPIPERQTTCSKRCSLIWMGLLEPDAEFPSDLALTV